MENSSFGFMDQVLIQVEEDLILQLYYRGHIRFVDGAFLRRGSNLMCRTFGPI